MPLPLLPLLFLPSHLHRLLSLLSLLTSPHSKNRRPRPRREDLQDQVRSVPRRREGRRPQAGEREEKEVGLGLSFSATSIAFFLSSSSSLPLFAFFRVTCPSFSCTGRSSWMRTIEWDRWIFESTSGTGRESAGEQSHAHGGLLLSSFSFKLSLAQPLPSFLSPFSLSHSLFPRHSENKHATLQGPNLGGLFGRQSGTIDGFSYSKANKEKAVKW